MPINPVSSWQSEYKSQTQDFFDKVAKVPGLLPAQFWGPYINSQFGSPQVAPPFSASTGTPNPASLSSIAFPPVGAPPLVAQILATAWSTYVTAIVWTPPPPVPPFTSILSVVINPATVAAGVAQITAALAAEFAVQYPNPRIYLDLKAKSIGSIFFSAAATLQVIITGTTGAPPVPLVMMSPIQ